MKVIADLIAKTEPPPKVGGRIIGLSLKPLVYKTRQLRLAASRGGRRLPMPLAFADRQTGMKKWANLSLALLVLLWPLATLAQQSSAQIHQIQTTGQTLLARNANGDKEVRNSLTNEPSYEIGPGDVLDIRVWKEPEVSHIVPVRPDGKISLPLLNDVQAAGVTPALLAEKIEDSLKKYLSDPQVTVIVTAINSQRIYILGEVVRAGTYPLLPGMTLLQALSSAGGFTQFARTKSIYLLREKNGAQVKYPFNYKEVVQGEKSEQNTVLKTGDTIVVP
jgi:polysaccharide export outer membrane protein